MKIVATAVAVPFLLLGGCVTTATAEQRASCAEMAGTMGTQNAHDHGETKGLPRNSMNLTHDQCRRILARRN